MTLKLPCQYNVLGVKHRWRMLIAKNNDWKKNQSVRYKVQIAGFLKIILVLVFGVFFKNILFLN